MTASNPAESSATPSTSRDVTRSLGRALSSEWFLVPAVFVLVTGAWEFGVQLLGVPAFILPPPSAIWDQLTSALASQRFWLDVRATASAMFLGYAIGVTTALILGLLVSQVRILEKTLLPYIVAFQAIPKTALAPLFLIWFGFGLTSKVVTAALVSFFPILITVIEGLNAADRDQVAMLRSLKASEWQVFRYVKFPSSLPFIFAGLNIGIVFALIGAVVGEFVGAQAGLGYRVLQMNFRFNIAGLFATLIALAALGLIPYYILRALQRRFVFWGEPEQLKAA